MRPVAVGTAKRSRWAAVGIWARVLAAPKREADVAGRPDWKTHFVDGTVVRAPAHRQLECLLGDRGYSYPRRPPSDADGRFLLWLE
jgi:hypothetical protein